MGNDNQNASQVASDNTRSAEPSGAVADLQRDALDNFSEIEAISLLKMDVEKDVYYATVLLKEKDSTKHRSAIASRLITYFVDQYHALLLPIFSESKESGYHERNIRYRQLFDPRPGGELAVRRFNRLKESPDYPASIRRWCRATVRKYYAALGSVLSAESIPSEIALTAFLEMLRNVFSQLFATKGGVFSHDSDAIVFFRDRFVDADSFFSESDILLYFQLLALKQQSLYFQSKPIENHDREFERLSNPLADFFQRFERYSNIAFTSESEIRKRRRFAIRLILGVLFTLVFVVLAYYMVFDSSLTSSVRLDGKKPGGIIGEYYKGIDFRTQILTRVDTEINFSTKGKLHPQLPKNHFSARWSGYIRTGYDGRHTICLDYDDGCRFYFHDKSVICDWKRGHKRRSCATVAARKGWHPIKIEYFEDRVKAKLRLLKGKNKDEVELVTGRDLCCIE